MPSGARSAPPPEPLVFFVDRALGRKIGAFLRAYEGIDRVELHDDHFPQNTPDTHWLAEVGARGWVVLTKDVHIKTNLVELDAVLGANVALFALARGHASAETMAATFMAAIDPMLRALRRFARPMVGTIAADGVITMRIVDGARLDHPKLIRPHGMRRR